MSEIEFSLSGNTGVTTDCRPETGNGRRFLVLSSSGEMRELRLKINRYLEMSECDLYVMCAGVLRWTGARDPSEISSCTRSVGRVGFNNNPTHSIF